VSVETEWNSGLVETLEDHLRHGLSYGLAAREMGLSRSSILAKAKRLRERGDRFFALKRQGSRKAKRTIWSERESISVTPNPPTRPTLVCVSSKSTLAPVHLPDSAPMGVTFIELQPGQCRYTIGAVDDMHLFCGKPATNGWCDAHRQLVYRKTAPIASSLATVA
jgi:hypothetical protein